MCLKRVLSSFPFLRVGHLILRALAIRASNPQNALARISFRSPKSLPPPPPVTPTILVIFYFNYINYIHFSLKASFKLLNIYIYLRYSVCISEK